MNSLVKSTIAITLLLLLAQTSVFSQDTAFTHKNFEYLCSKECFGRGYTYKGDRKARNYIVSQLKQLKLKSFSKGYVQEFRITVNTFPKKVKLSVDGKQLHVGSDYIVMPNSGSIKGSFPLAWYGSTTINDSITQHNFFKHDYSNSIMVWDTSGVKALRLRTQAKTKMEFNVGNARALIEVSNRDLSSWMSSSSEAFGVLKVKKGLIEPTSKQIDIDIKSKLQKNYSTYNIAGYIEGEVDSFIVITSHYDHLGGLGRDTWFPGANDNASGVTMNLDIARYFSLQNAKPHYCIAFLFFSGEELGLEGSKYYVNNPLFPLSRIKFLFNLDMIGTGEDGITIVNSPKQPIQYKELLKINERDTLFKNIKSRELTMNSDHYPFAEKDVPCFYLYTRGTDTHYHSIGDLPAPLSLYAYHSIFKLITEWIKEQGTNEAEIR
jgi:aminopeptidase YwaD